MGLVFPVTLSDSCMSIYSQYIAYMPQVTIERMMQTAMFLFLIAIFSFLSYFVVRLILRAFTSVPFTVAVMTSPILNTSEGFST